MRLHNIEIPVRNLPTVDPGFIPLGLYMDAFLKEASKPVSVAIERENGNISVKCKFADEFRKIAEYIEINTSEIPAVAG